jgi:ComF family protein
MAPSISLATVSANLRHLLAPDCVVCCIAAAEPPGSPVCAACRADYFPTGTPRCRLCANRLPANRLPPGPLPPLHARLPRAAATGTDLCGRCLAQPPHFDATFTLADYAPPVDAMVAALKFHNRLDLGRAFGLLLGEQAQSWRGDAVVPLPLAAPRLRERGYNQAEEIARALVARLCRPLLRDALLRTRHCASQQSLRLAQRRTNVRGAFAAGPAVAGLRLLLVDDVLTSGSTLDAAAAALKRAGARSVANCVVARTP